MDESIEALARALAEGQSVGFPTETVYGVGASVRQPAAIARIYEIKERPLERALVLHVAAVDALHCFAADVPAWARRAAEALWPGPLTLVVPAKPSVPPVAIGGGETVGIRAVAHPLTRALLERLGEHEGGVAGIAGTSANRHGHVPATEAAHVRAGLGIASDRLAGVLDGGPCRVGIESTVVRDEGGAARILRPGGVSAERLAAVSGVEVRFDPSQPSDTQRVRWVLAGSAVGLASDDAPRPGDVVLSTAPDPAPAGGVHWIQVPRDLDERSQRLFDDLRRIDALGDGDGQGDAAGRVWIERAPDRGLGPAINARLERWVLERRG